jgi:hypothetical protein
MLGGLHHIIAFYLLQISNGLFAGIADIHEQLERDDS